MLMEVANLGRSDQVKEEKGLDSTCDEEEIAVKVPISTETRERSSMGSDTQTSSSSQKEKDGRLESARVEMGEVREENERLKMYLNRIMKDYQTLQMQFQEAVEQEAKKSTTSASIDEQEIAEEPELVSLSLGRFPRDSKKEEKNQISIKGKEDEKVNEGLALGLTCKFEVSKLGDASDPPLPNSSRINNLEESKEAAEDSWPPSKALKTVRSGVDDEVSHQNPTKKARVCVRARCDTPTMNDGCQWRKYGQKIAKGNPCPRAYYRCTVAPSCPVRKQVQRCAEDTSILITTYEGTHNHPLPMSATAMASTTSAAASMLLSSSSSSNSTATTTFSASLHGLNFHLSNNYSKSNQFYIPNNSSFSPSPSHPTITLDLTSNPSSSTSSSSFIRSSPCSSNHFPSAPKFSFSSASLNFSSEPNTLSWGTNNGLLSYNNIISQQPYPKNPMGILNLNSNSRQAQPLENTYQSYTQRHNNPTQSLPTDTVAAATKVITSDPSFQSALAAALSSIIGGNGSGGSGTGENVGHQMKWIEPFPVASTLKGSACSSSYLNKVSPTPLAGTQAPGSLMFMQANTSPSPMPKSASGSPGDSRELKN